MFISTTDVSSFKKFIDLLGNSHTKIVYFESSKQIIHAYALLPEGVVLRMRNSQVKPLESDFLTEFPDAMSMGNFTLYTSESTEK